MKLSPSTTSKEGMLCAGANADEEVVAEEVVAEEEEVEEGKEVPRSDPSVVCTPLIPAPKPNTPAPPNPFEFEFEFELELAFAPRPPRSGDNKLSPPKALEDVRSARQREMSRPTTTINIYASGRRKFFSCHIANPIILSTMHGI